MSQVRESKTKGSVIPIQLPSQKQEVKYTANWRLVLPMPVYTQLMTYVNGFDTECSGAGLVSCEIKDAAHVFTMYEAFLPEKQKNSAGATDIEADEVGRLVTRLVREGKRTEDLRCHWHSHNTMSVFHSGTDEDNYKVLKTGEYLVSLVLNKAGEIKASVHYYKPFTLSAENIPVTVMLDDIEVSPQWAEDIKKVKEFDKPKVIESSFKGWEKWKDESSSYGGYKRQDWEAERDAHAANSKEGLEQYLLCMTDVYEPLEEVTCRWEEAECKVLDVITNTIVKINMDVDVIRPATPEDFEPVEKLPKGVKDYGSC